MQLDLLQKELAEMRQAATSDESSDDKAPGAFKTISEVAEALGVAQHVLRFWESRFPQIKPLKLRGGRRYYRPQDIEILMMIQSLLYKQGYTIKGARKAVARLQHHKEEVALPPAKSAPKAGLSEREKSQVAVIRQELLGMKELLEPHII